MLPDFINSKMKKKDLTVNSKRRYVYKISYNITNISYINLVVIRQKLIVEIASD